MKRIVTALSILLLAAAAAGASGSREMTERYDWKPGQEIVLEFGVGELRVVGGDGSQVVFEVVGRCRWDRRESCEEALEKIEITSRSSDRRLRLKLEADSSWRRINLELDATVTVPRGAALHVEMGVGEVEVEGVRGDLRVELGVGEARVRYPEALAGSVSIDAGVGEASLRGAGSRVEGRRSLLIGSEVIWEEGAGKGRIDVEVGVGEAQVWLE